MLYDKENKKKGECMTKEEIAAVLKKIRLEAGMTQKAAAEKINRKQQTLASWETGQSQPDANTLFILCSTYGTTVDKAFGFAKTDDNKNSPTPSGMGEEEIMESAEKIYKALLSAGYVKEGQELTPAQIDFLDGLSAIISAFFGKCE